jgi:hypothetical protein
MCERACIQLSARRAKPAYLFTVIVGGTFAVILRVLRKVLWSWGVGCELAIKTRPLPGR